MIEFKDFPRVDPNDLWDRLEPEAQRRIGVLALSAQISVRAAEALGEPDDTVEVPSAVLETIAHADTGIYDIVLELLAAAPDYPTPLIVSTHSIGFSSCLVCGCTERQACPKGCGWANATQTLCTACAERLPGGAVANG